MYILRKISKPQQPRPLQVYTLVVSSELGVVTDEKISNQGAQFSWTISTGIQKSKGRVLKVREYSFRCLPFSFGGWSRTVLRALSLHKSVTENSIYNLFYVLLWCTRWLMDARLAVARNKQQEES